MVKVQNPADEKILSHIVSMVSENTGINFRETHKAGIFRFIENRVKELNISCDEYALLLNENKRENSALINASTVSETYFFREESQFNLVKKLISGQKNVNIWSAACASGEEIYSLKLLCDSMRVEASFFASDINTDKLKIVKNGIFNKQQTVREIDGKNFHYLLNPYLSDEEIIFPDKVKSSVEVERINLIDFDSYKVLGERKFNIIFLRNVFIYFSLEERYKILNFVAENYLLDDGYIFVSLSETAQLETKFLVPGLEKICMDDVFVFHKKRKVTEVSYE